MTNQQNKPEYVSYSGVKDWDFCPHYYKLTKIDKIKIFQGNIYTAFGQACHKAIEDALVNSSKIEKEKGYFDIIEQFEDYFYEQIALLPKEIREAITDEEAHDFIVQGHEIMPEVLPSLEEYLPGYKVLSVEHKLDELFDDYSLEDYNFKGYIDLVVQTPDDKIHVLDWKTCSWGWKAEKKQDAITTYQLTLYKEFYARKYNVDKKNVETHFGLLKRTAKVGSKTELFRVTSGTKKINNALKLVYNAVYNIDHDNHVKKKTSCLKCPFFNTVHCKHTVGEPKNV